MRQTDRFGIFASKRGVSMIVMPVMLLFLTACMYPNPSFEGSIIHDQDLVPEGPHAYEIGPGDILGIDFFLMSTERSSTYEINVGDSLNIEYFQDPSLNRNVSVRRDGKISLPLVGDVEVEGLTVDNVTTTIRGLYQDEYVNPQIIVNVEEGNSQLQELARYLSANGERGGADRVCPVSPDGRVVFPLLDEPVLAAGRTLDEISREVSSIYRSRFGNMDVSISVDTMRSNLIYVVGEVRVPGFYNMTVPTTTMQAIAMAGGFQDNAELTTVVVITRDQDRYPVGRIIDVEAVLEDGNIGRDRVLCQYDIIYVPPTKISQVADFIDAYFTNLLPINVSFGMSYRVDSGNTR